MKTQRYRRSNNDPARTIRRRSHHSWPAAIRIAAWVSLALLLGAGSSLALDHSGTIASNETWFAADNPHNVVGNVTVSAGVTLTIEAGAEVYFDASRRLDVQGTLTAVGAPGQEILFTRSGSSDWNYPRFLSSGSGTFDYCTIEHASYGIYSAGTGAVSVAHTTLRNNNYGIYSTSSAAFSISDCLVQDNARGFYGTGGSVDLASTTFSGNTAYGFYSQNMTPNILDANVVFNDNATGLRVDDVVGVNLTTAMTVTGSTEAGLYLDGCDGVSVDNQVLSGNSGAGGAVLAVDCGDLALGAGNTLGGAGLENSWPVTVGAGTSLSAGSIIPTSGNTNNDIQVAVSNSAKSAIWRKFTDLDYIVTGNATVAAGGELTIAPGVNLRFDGSRRLDVQGTLTAVGAPGQEILFTRSGSSDWNYPRFLSSGSGTFDYCTIEHASYGIYSAGTGAVSVAHTTLRNNNYGIYSTSSAAFSISDCLVQDNARGFYGTGGSVDLASTTFSGNTAYGFYSQNMTPNILDANVVFNDNATGLRVDDVVGVNLTTAMTVTGSTEAGLYLDGCDGVSVDNQVLSGNSGAGGAVLAVDCGDLALGAGNTLGGAGLENSWPVTVGAGTSLSAGSIIPTSGNTNNDIQVAVSNSAKSAIWRKFTDLDYIVTGNATVAAGGELTIAPGVNLRFDGSRRLDVQGTLTAVGAPGQEILFTRSGSSDWNYPRFLSSGSGTFDYCTIEHASYGIYSAGTGAVSVAHTTLRNNNYGIYSTSSAAFSISDCLVQDNARGFYGTGGSVDLSSTTFSGNTAYGFYSQNMAPNLLDASVVFNDNATGLRVDDVVGVNLTTVMTVTGSTEAGLYLDGCDGVSVDNQVLSGNSGVGGAVLAVDCGDLALGAGNTIGGAGLENSWPVTIGAGTSLSAASVIPTSGNTNNDIQVTVSNSAKSALWRKFTDLDYIVTGNTTVAAGGELTIAPGVNLRLDGSRRLDIQGTLTAVGAPGQEILFTRSGSSDWNYPRFLSSGSGTFDYCTIEHASYGIYSAGSGAISVAHTTLRNNNYGIYSTSTAAFSISDCLVQDNNYGIYGVGTGAISVAQATLQNNNYGVYSTPGATISLSDCLVQGNERGVYATGGTVSFLRSQIINNTGYGIYLNGGEPMFGQSLAEWNDIYGNGSGNLGRDLRNGVTDITAQFVHWGTMDYGEVLDHTWDLHDDYALGYITILPLINAAHDIEATAVDDIVPDRAVPAAFGLHQNAPNPFNPSTVIRFDLPGAAPVQLKIFDVSGALVATPLDGPLPAGYHEVAWSGRDDQGRAVPSGVYFYQIAAGAEIATKRMMLIK